MKVKLILYRMYISRFYIFYKQLDDFVGEINYQKPMKPVHITCEISFFSKIFANVCFRGVIRSRWKFLIGVNHNKFSPYSWSYMIKIKFYNNIHVYWLLEVAHTPDSENCHHRWWLWLVARSEFYHINMDFQHVVSTNQIANQPFDIITC